MSGPAPAVAAVRSAVRADLADLAGRAPGGDRAEPPADPGGALVLVACSGGPDSLALAAAAGFVAPRLGLRAGAVVVDHGWHDGSAQVAARAADAARGLGLAPVLVLRVPDAAGRDGGDREGRARAARYALLESAAARTGAAAVLLGHTRDDQAEQVLLGLARGSGARSLSGMPARRGVHRRPLLALARVTTEAACAALGLQPWHDPANADPAFTRVRVRTALLPALERDLGPGVAAALARTADQLREDADALDALAEQLRAAARRAPGPGEAPGGLDAAALAAAPPALRTRALRREAIAAGCPAGALTRAHVLAVDSLVTAWRGQGPLPLPGGAAARRACGRLTFLTAPDTGAGTRATGTTGATRTDRTTTDHATTD